MDIKDLGKVRDKARASIRDAIEAELIKLEKETGLTVKSIYVSTRNVTSHGDALPVFVLDAVDIEIAI